MMCSSLLYKILLNALLKFRLNINIIYFDFTFHTVLTHNISSFKAVKVDFCFLTFI